MPGKNNSKKPARKGRSGRKTGMVGLTNTPCIVPPYWRGKMFYNSIVQINPAAGAAVANVFRWNSIYDPDFTGVGVSAYAYGTLSALYGKYRVLSARATVEFVNVSTTTPLTCFIVLNPVTTVGVNIAQILGQRFVWSRGIGTVSGTASVTHTVSAAVAKIYGAPERQVRDEDDFASITGANPNNGVYMHVGAYANGASAGAVNLHVRIEYDVVWSLPLEMS